jgi:hypothetical protein
VTRYRPDAFRERLAEDNHFVVSVMRSERVDVMGGESAVA